ncbi:hypothetical protein ABWI01_00240 [Oceanicaulis alexandrii]|uniref:hypothetical protein n=1 Tax=Oceanicaulis alexandrii TaxID=153233 RepID=UPI0035CEB219
MELRNIRIAFICVATFFAILSFFSIALYIAKFNGNLSSQNNDWGDFGSFVGGVFGTSVAICALLSVIYGLIVQSIEFKSLRNQISQQRNKDQLRDMTSGLFSSFESIFLEKTTHGNGNKTKETLTSYRALHQHSHMLVLNIKGKDNESVKEIIEKNKETFNWTVENLGHLSSQLTQILLYIDENLENPKTEIDSIMSRTTASFKIALAYLIPITEDSIDMYVKYEVLDESFLRKYPLPESWIHHITAPQNSDNI